MTGLAGAGFEWSDPLFLFGLVFVPLVFVRANARPAAVTWSSLSLVATRGRSLRARHNVLPAALLACAAACLVLALAGPRTGDAVSEVKREGIAIAMVVDRSGSMQARDFVRGDRSVSRLDAVKQIFRDFVLGGGDAGRAPRRPGRSRLLRTLCGRTLAPHARSRQPRRDPRSTRDADDPGRGRHRGR